ncbi:MAG: hypothetical protein JW791_02705 [Nanoarchaeota archaeon]|nr:hypothetical protein [Nanoarchaeota archaeon]
MDLKLKDEITKILIETPGVSISELAKRTGNYYSYTHKIINDMKKDNLIIVKKTKKDKKTITLCELSDDYKNNWIMNLKKLLKSVTKDLEVKAAITIMYGYFIISYLRPKQEGLLASSLIETSEVSITNLAAETNNIVKIILLLIPLLLIMWFIRKKKRII